MPPKASWSRSVSGQRVETRAADPTSEMRPSVMVTPSRPAIACPSIDSHGDRIGSDGIAGSEGCRPQRQLGGRFGVDVGQAADGSGEPHTEFDLQRATSEDRPLSPLRWRVAKVMRKSSAVLPTDRLLMWAMRAVRGRFCPRRSSPRSQPGWSTRSDAVRLVVAIALWTGWAVVLGALLRAQHR